VFIFRWCVVEMAFLGSFTRDWMLDEAARGFTGVKVVLFDDILFSVWPMIVGNLACSIFEENVGLQRTLKFQDPRLFNGTGI
jgi:hypothetical protein